ncbi:MAG: peptidoglycan DD-metalloendopeptidase family protein [Pseudomonadota bacterium]
MTRTATLRALTAPAALAAALALSACAQDRGGEPSEASAPSSTPPPETSATSATQTPPAIGAGEPSQGGLVVYRDYAAVVARPGDTVRQMADRVGISPSELAAYNGLPTSYQPKPGDELVLPPRPEGYRIMSRDGEEETPTSSAPASTTGPGEMETETRGDAQPAASPRSGWDPARIGEAIDRTPDGNGTDVAATPPDPASGDGYREVSYHKVGPDETIYSIARDYGLPAERLIAWNALSGPSYSVREGQVLVIPNASAAAAPEGRAPRITPPGEAGDATPPPSAGRPLPPDTVAPRPLESPQLGRFQTLGETATAAQAPEEAPEEPPAQAAPEPAAPQETASASRQAPASSETRAEPDAPAPSASGGLFMRPVPGEILRPYSREPGDEKNEGVDFAAEPGQPVRAAADGTVALVSTSLGEWGNIVLIRHDDRLMTVYGRMGAVAVSKGETVQAGDVLGDVAPGEGGPSTLHFEVRRGALTEDPQDYL